MELSRLKPAILDSGHAELLAVMDRCPYGGLLRAADVRKFLRRIGVGMSWGLWESALVHAA